MKEKPTGGMVQVLVKMLNGASLTKMSGEGYWLDSEKIHAATCEGLLNRGLICRTEYNYPVIGVYQLSPKGEEWLRSIL